MESDTRTGHGSGNNQTTEPRTQDGDEEWHSWSQMMDLVIQKYMKREVDSNITERKLLDKLAEQSATRGFYEQKLVELQTTSEELDATYQKNIASSAESLLKGTKNMEAVSGAIRTIVQHSESDLKGRREHRAQLKQKHDIMEQQLMSLTGESADKAQERALELVKEHNRCLEEANNVTESMWNISQQLKANMMSTLRDKENAMQCELAAGENRLQQQTMTMDEMNKRKGKQSDEVAQLEQRLKQMKRQYDNEMARMNAQKVQSEMRLSEDEVSIDALKRSIKNQTDFTKTIRDENSPVQQEIDNIENVLKELMIVKTEKNHQIEELKKSIKDENAKNAALLEETKQIDLATQTELQNVADLKEKIESTNANIDLLDLNISANRTMFKEEETELMSDIKRLAEMTSTEKSEEELHSELACEIADIDKYNELRSENEKLHAAELAQQMVAIEQQDANIAATKRAIEELIVESERALAQQTELSVASDRLDRERDEMRNELLSLEQLCEEEGMYAIARERNIEETQATIDTMNIRIGELKNELERVSPKEADEQWAQRKDALLEEMSRLDAETVAYEGAIKTKKTDVLDKYNQLCNEQSEKKSALQSELEDLQSDASAQDTYTKRLEVELAQVRALESKEQLEADKVLREKEDLEGQLREMQQSSSQKDVASTVRTQMTANAGDAAVSGAAQRRILKFGEMRTKVGAVASQPKSIRFVEPPPPTAARHSVYDFSSGGDSSDGGLPFRTPPTNFRRRRHSSMSPPNKRLKFNQRMRAAGAAAGPAPHQRPRRRAGLRSNVPPPASLSQPQPDTGTDNEEPTRDVDHAKQ